METVHLMPDPHKRIRLGLLLDRLSLQIRKADCFRLSLPNFPNSYAMESEIYNNADYEIQEVPLNLSLKSDEPKMKSVRFNEAQSTPQLNSREVEACYNPLPKLSPLQIVERNVIDNNIGYSCDICGQTFRLHDRLAKHVASRHRRKQCESGSKNYECMTCGRRFTRSDMLTRHARLHTGLKPYSCSQCGQVFSRSDHLATHQRTHTGEKPYKCSQCAYAACRRDMITRHMRTHMPRPSSNTTFADR